VLVEGLKRSAHTHGDANYSPVFWVWWLMKARRTMVMGTSIVTHVG